MKSACLIISLLFIALISKAQHKAIDGFLGIKFGNYPGQVIDALKAKDAVEDIEYNSNYSHTGKLRFKHVTLGSRICTDFIVSFTNDKACQAEFIFDPEVEAKCVDYYLDLVNDIKVVYGDGDVERNPENWGDDNIASIKSGIANFATDWHDGSNLIWAHIILGKYSEIFVSLIYRNNYLFNLYQNQQNEKNKSDL